MPEITTERLALLEKKERAHDDYLYALRGIRARAARFERRGIEDPLVPTEPLAAALWGYKRCLTDMALAIVQASRSREDER